MFHRTPAPAVAALLAALAAPALGQELTPGAAGTPAVAPSPALVTTPAAPLGDWAGFYAGGQISFGQLDFELDDGDAGEQDLDGAVGGLHAGYLQDLGRVVAGAEIAYDRADLEADGDASFDAGADLDSITRLGARLGYDAGRALPYAAVGYAHARFFDELAATGEDNADGYYFGAGVEYAVTERLSLGGEVLRHEFDLDVDGLDAGLTTLGLRASYRF